jgi:hypothetical protein
MLPPNLNNSSLYDGLDRVVSQSIDHIFKGRNIPNLKVGKLAWFQ